MYKFESIKRINSITDTDFHVTFYAEAKRSCILNFLSIPPLELHHFGN